MHFTFAQLPTEIQIIVLHNLASLADRLNFRLVSSAANTLVLEPCFWPVLALLVRSHHTTSSASSSTNAGQANRPLSLAAALLHHHSDSHLRLRSHALDAGLSVSLTIAANLPSGSSSGRTTATARAEGDPTTSTLSPQTMASLMTTSSIATGSKKRSTEECKSKEDSFLAFLSTLAMRSRSAEGVQELSIEGWASEASLGQLLRLLTLHPFDQLERLRLHTNALFGFPTFGVDSNASLTGGSLASLHVCNKLTILDLKNCQHLHDLSGFYPWMPHLEEINLEGCLELVHIAPFPLDPTLKTSIAGGSQSSQPSQPSTHPQPLRSLRKLNLTHTKVGDEDLIWLLEQCSQLHELRLDQCYSLTPESISAIAGRGRPIHPQLGPTAAGVQLQPFHATAVSAPAAVVAAGAAEVVPDLLHQSLQTKQSILAASSPADPGLTILSLNNCYDLTDESIRSLVGCRHLDLLLIRGLRTVREDTLEWLHSQGVPLRKALSPLGKWRHWHTI